MTTKSIKKDQLVKLFEIFFTDLLEHCETKIEFSEDFYLDLTIEDRFNITEKPEITIGSLYEDIEFLIENHIHQEESWSYVASEKFLNLLVSCYYCQLKDSG